MTSLYALLLSVLVVTLPSAGRADALSRAGLAGLLGSERLQQFSIGQALLQNRDDQAITQAMQRSLRQSGFYHSGLAPSVLSRTMQVDPVLAYEANINGGFLNDSFDIFGLKFDVDPDSRALSGVVGGARANSQMRIAYAEGGYLDLRGTVEAVHSPEHDIGRQQAGIEGCARNHLQGWSFADLCVNTTQSNRRLSNSTTDRVSLSFARLTAASTSEHEFSLGLARSVTNGSAQTAVSTGWNAVWDRAVTSLELTIAASIPDETALRRRVQGTVAGYWQDRVIRLGVWRQIADGGLLLGIPREDTLSGVSLSIQARQNLIIELIHQETRSSVELFDEQQTGIVFRFDLGRS